MKKYTALFLFFFSVALTAQEKEVSIPITGNFKEIKVFDKIHADLIKGDENKVVITGFDKDQLDAETKNDKLKVTLSIDNLWKDSNTSVKIYYKDAEIIDANEGASLNLVEVVRQEKLVLRVQEGAYIRGEIKVNDLEIKAVTGGTIDVKGETDSQKVEVKTGGNYQGNQLTSNNTKVEVTAGGNAEVYATEYCGAEVKAGGRIVVYGDPKTMDQKKVFGGKIIKK